MCSSEFIEKMEIKLTEVTTDYFDSDTITINIRGKVITLFSEDVSKKLDLMAVIQPYYKSSTKEFVLQRNPAIIHNILDYFCGRKFHLPRGFCMVMIEDELKFWNISPTDLEYCCLNEFTKQKEKEKTTNQIRKNWHTSHFPEQADVNSFRYKMWRFLEQPSSSKIAMVWAIMISVACVTSIGVLCVESVMSTNPEGYKHSSSDRNTTKIPLLTLRTSLASFEGQEKFEVYHIVGIIDMCLVTLMSIEVILRVVVAYNKRIFFSSFFTVSDILFIACTWLTHLWVWLFYQKVKPDDDIPAQVLSTFLVLSRLLRIPRLFYAIRHSKGLLTLAWSIRASLKDIAFLTILVLIIVSGFGILIYYAERGSGDFPDIFHGMWWALVTITTVGYGDKYPSTVPGFMVGACCAWIGVLTITLTVPIFATHFSNYFEHFNALYRMHAFKKNRKKKSILALVRASFASQLSIETSVSNPGPTCDPGSQSTTRM